MRTEIDGLGEWKEHHLEQPEQEAPQEFINGEWITKEHLLEKLNSNSRVVFSEDEHCDGWLWIKVKFQEED